MNIRIHAMTLLAEISLFGVTAIGTAQGQHLAPVAWMGPRDAAWP